MEMENQVAEQSGQWCYLAEDFILKEILPKLPTKSIVGLKSVSRSWQAGISDSGFMADHTRALLLHGSASDQLLDIVGAEYWRLGNLRVFVVGRGGRSKFVELDTTYIMNKAAEYLSFVGSSNGLVCLRSCILDQSCDLVIWNPVSREFKRVPSPAADSLRSRPGLQRYYFGMVKADYKVFCLEHVWDMNAITTAVDVYVKVLSKGGTWRELERFSRFEVLRRQGQGLTLDGTMYWLIQYKSYKHPYYVRSFELHVLSFDLRSEEFDVLQGPSLPEGGFDSVGLITWEGCRLCAVLANYDYSKWQLFGVKTALSNSNWTTITFATPSFSPDHRCLGLLGDRLLLKTKDGLKCYSYDLATQRIIELPDMRDISFCSFKGFAHIHTLVSPN